MTIISTGKSQFIEMDKLEFGVAMEWCLMTTLKIILITVSVAFIMFGY
jgi:hypothetical protein